MATSLHNGDYAARLESARAKIDASGGRAAGNRAKFSIPPTITRLSGDVIQEILSRLNLKEVARISTLSSGWRQAWRYHPALIFSIDKLFDGKDKGDQEFVTTVNAILKDHYRIVVNRFKVNYGLCEEHGDDLDRWLSYAVSSKAKNVVLDLRPAPKCPDSVYNFPLHLFDDRNSSCVMSLRLVLVCLRPALGFCGFANLRSLKLHRAYVSKDLHCMMSHCAVLEWLSLTDCFIPSFTMSEPLDHLQYTCIQNCSLQSIELHAPNLTVFEYSEQNAQQFMAKERCDFVNLRHLDMEALFNSELRYHGVAHARKTSGRKLSHLKRVYMSGFADLRDQLELARYILEHATALERMIIDPAVKTRFGSHCAQEGGPLYQDLMAKYLFLPKFPEVLTVLRPSPPQCRL
ncbi:hypothetical protein ACQ4PT_055313 [Festuca glaucescens]